MPMPLTLVTLMPLLAFVPGPSVTVTLHSGSPSFPAAVMSGSRAAAGGGFGKAKPPPPPKKAVKKAVRSEGQVRRDKAASDMDALKAQGLPEYMVMVREAPADGEPSKWYPVGGMCVPRSSSETVALSMAIFNNEEDLLKGAYRSYPFLKQSPHALEYGYRLKEFADDPVKLAQKDLTEPSDNPLLDWFNTLDNPLNDGSGWFNPLKRKQ